MKLDVDHLIGRVGLRHVRMVVAILEENSLVGAAMRLRVTQSAATKTLREAEAHLGVRLFDRTTRGVIATDFGRSFAAHCRSIMAQLDRAAEGIEDIRKGLTGRIAVGALPFGSFPILSKAIAALRDERPNVAISVAEGSDERLMAALQNGELDVVIGALPDYGERRGNLRNVLFRDSACVVVRYGHPLTARGTTLRLADLAGQNWVLPGPATSLRRTFDRAFREEGIDPPGPAIESMSAMTSRDLILETNYLTVLPRRAAEMDPARGLAVLPIALRQAVVPIGLVTRQEIQPSASTTSFLRCFDRFRRATAAELASSAY